MFVLLVYQVPNTPVVLLELVFVLLLGLQEFLMEFVVLIVEFIDSSVYLLVKNLGCLGQLSTFVPKTPDVILGVTNSFLG